MKRKTTQLRRYLSGFMQVYHGINALPKFKKAVITIGTFDGVHHGHQIIIDALLQESKRISGESVIITFDPHPRQIVQPQVPLQLINTLKEKVQLIENKGVHNLVIVPFTEQFAEQSAAAYIEQFLVQNFSPECIIIGYDHHFGKNREGNFELLYREKEKWGYRIIEIPEHINAQITISSTKIRNALMDGSIDIANKLLGYDFFFTGKVVKGDALGRTLGYPTANLESNDEHKINIAEGVYAVYAEVNGVKKKGLLSLGTRPTLKDSTRKTEVHLLDFEGDIYGAEMTVNVLYFLRKQSKFETLELLKVQMQKDEEEVREVLNDSSF